jgi:preprotein translocase subunit SecB
MTDTAGTDENGAGAPAGPESSASEPGLRILAQFIRDLSFENPRAPDSLRSTGEQSQIDLGVEMNARTRADNLYEVDLKLTATAQTSEGPVFQLELLYGGIFQIQGVAEADMEPMLLIECPRFLFPFARRVIADMTAEGGFPPFLLDPIDFRAVYLARRSQLDGPPAGTA